MSHRENISNERLTSGLYARSPWEKIETIIGIGFLGGTEGYLLRVRTPSNGATTVPRKRYKTTNDSIYHVCMCGCIYNLSDISEQLDAFKGSLNRKGVRERALQKQLDKSYDKIWLVYACFLGLRRQIYLNQEATIKILNFLPPF